MDSSISQEKPTRPLPDEMLEKIFLYLTEAEDLCRVAQCNRDWREAANRDKLWRPVCRAKGWEHYGTITDDLSKETAFCSNAIFAFPFESVVIQSELPGLAGTCKWKEIYMKARHLEANWSKNRYNVVSFEFGSPGYRRHNDYAGLAADEVILSNLAGEGNYLAGGISNGTLRIWDASNGQCRHIIQVDVSKEREALKMKNGVIAVGCKDGTIRTYSAQTGEQLHALLGHRLAVSRLFFDGETIVSFARPRNSWEVFEDNDIRVWSSVDDACRFVFRSSSEDTRLVSLDYLDKTVVGAYSDHTIRLWDAGNGTCKGTITEDVDELISCHLGDGIVITGGIHAAKMWNSQTGECLKTFEEPGVDFGDTDDEAETYAFNGEFLLATSEFLSLKLFNLDGKYLANTESHGTFYLLEPIYFRSNKLITADRGAGGTMHIWNIDHSGFHLIKQLRTAMYDDEVRGIYSVAWMNHAKLAFVHYYTDEPGKRLQIPRVIVHHYW